MAKEQTYTIRLRTEGGKTVAADLVRIGENGEKSFIKIGKSATQASALVSAAGAAFIRAFPALTLTGTGAAFIKITRDLSDLNDEAKKLGLSTDHLQELRYAAVATGNDVDGMTKAITTFTAKVAEARTGAGELIPILKAYGIDLKDSTGRQKTVNELLREYVAKIRDVAGAEDKLLLTRKGFGREAEGLVEIFRMGPEYLDQMAVAARESGNIIDAELIEKADAFNDAWEMAKFSFENWIKGGTYDFVARLGQAFDNMVWNLVELDEVLGRLMNMPGILSFDFGNLGEYAQNIREAIILGQAAVRNTRAEMNREPSGILDFDPSMPADMDVPLVPPEPPRIVTEGERRHTQAIRDQIEALKFRLEQMQRTTEEQLLYNELRRAGVSLDSAAGQEIKKYVEQMNDLTKAQKEQEEQTKRQIESAKKMGEAFDSALERIIDGFGDGKLSADELRQAVFQLAKDILTAQNSLNGQPMFFGNATGFGQGIADFFRNLWPFENGGIMTAAGPLPLMRYEMGGVANRPQMAIFGEGANPEAFVPLPDGRSIPVSLTGGGQGNVYVTVNNNTSAKVTTSQRQRGDGTRELIVQLDEAVGKLLDDPASKTVRGVQKVGSLTQRG